MAGVSMKDIKLRIRSMESTKHITKAMEMVASSKLRRAQENVQRSRPYFELMYTTLTDIASRDTEFASSYVEARPVNRSLYVVIAGDRGLAGGYNHNVLRLAEDDMKNKNSVVLPVGKKAIETLTSHGYEIFADDYNLTADISISDSFTMARAVCNGFLKGDFDEVYIVYTHFASMLTQTPSIVKVLPLEREEVTSSSGEVRQITLYEPDSVTAFNTIIPEYVGGMIYGAICESIASEQGARRNAMESATKNAEEMIDDLSLKYNRARQGAITQEITEIVAGADA